jgi:hypothetical protein
LTGPEAEAAMVAAHDQIDSLPHEASPAEIAAHRQAETHRYTVAYPAHGDGRDTDPHYKAFHAFHRKFGPAAKCLVGEHVGFEHCSKGPLQLHHAFLEWALQNAASPTALHKDFPAIRDDATQGEIDAWVEQDTNFRWLCQFHHVGHGGAHVASHSDWSAQLYVPDLIH